jgi:Fe-Mn family superoxide dismutase
MPLTLPTLPYAKDALAPHMSAETLEFHHDRHHQTYVDNANKLATAAGLADLSVQELIMRSHGSDQSLFNNVAQHWNHNHFWEWMTPGGGGSALPARLQKAIESDLNGYAAFRSAFVHAGLGQFGSGWVWLSLRNGRLEVSKTPNGENPLVLGATPILGCDLWEHSYYIDYRNARAKYLDAFLDHLVNWEKVEEMLMAA